MMGLYVGMDLHARNTYIAILDENYKRVFKKRVTNESSTHCAYPSTLSKMN